MKKLSLIAIVTIAAVSLSSAAFAGEGKEKKRKSGGQHMMLKKMDTNEDGAVSAEEFKAAHAKHFTGADTDGDGSLSAQEFDAIGEKMRQKHKEAMEQAKKKRAQKNFSKLDTDGDGKISKAEFDARGDRTFIRMDRNDDGVLDKKDRRARKHKKMRERDK